MLLGGNNKVLAAKLLAGFISFDIFLFNHPSDFYKVVQAGSFEASQTPELISCLFLNRATSLRLFSLGSLRDLDRSWSPLFGFEGFTL